jgi:arylsulfatase A-like enzyme
MWGPKFIRGGQVKDGLISLMDLAPTILELAGLDAPEWMEAESLVPALKGEEWVGREYVFSEHARDFILTETALMTMVRDARWKLVEFIDFDEGQLFDLDSDPHEEVNLWAAPEHRDVRHRLEKAISTWRATSSMLTATWAKDTR